MKTHYRKFKGYKRHPGRRVYLMPMTEAEVRERRLLYGLIGALGFIICGIVTLGVIIA